MQLLRNFGQSLASRLDRSSGYAACGPTRAGIGQALKDSSTSSKPPSSDIVKPKPKKVLGGEKSRDGWATGAQQQLREPLPPERVDETIDYEINDDDVQRLGLLPPATLKSFSTSNCRNLRSMSPISTDRLPGCRWTSLHPRCPELNGPIFGPRMLATIGWLKSVGHCSYSTDRNVDGRCLAGSGLARLPGEALHGHDLRIAGRRLRRTDRSDSPARTTGQRRNEHQGQRQEALDLVHHGGHIQRLSHRRRRVRAKCWKSWSARSSRAI